MGKTTLPNKVLKEFFETILDRRFSEADEILKGIEVNVREVNNDFMRGFFQGLRGIFYMHKSGDQDTFLGKLDLNNVDALRKYYNEFLENSKRKLHSDYDRGYFLALAEYIGFILRRRGIKV
ncbi:MAG: hypothetical protein QW424_03690 [Candidatus Bathyarchaeia archaeon]